MCDLCLVLFVLSAIKVHNMCFIQAGLITVLDEVAQLGELNGIVSPIMLIRSVEAGLEC